MQSLQSLKNQVSGLLESGRELEAISVLENELEGADTSAAIAELAAQLASIYHQALGVEGASKVRHYCVLAARTYIHLSRPAPAIAILVWLRAHFPQCREEREVEHLIASRFCRRPQKRKKQDDSLPVPTPYQEIQARISFEEQEEAWSREQIREAESKSFTLLSRLKYGEITRLLDVPRLQTCTRGKFLFRSGQEADAFFLISKGNLKLEGPDQQIRELSEGDFVGDLCLLAEIPHSADARAGSQLEVLEFPKAFLQNCFRSIPRLEQEVVDLFYKKLFLHAAKKSFVLRFFSEEELEKCWECFLPVHVSAGKTVLTPEKDSDRFFLILKGVCEIRPTEGKSLQLGPGHFVGERGLILKSERLAEVETLSDCFMLECDEWSFQELCELLPDPHEAREKMKALFETESFPSGRAIID